MGIVIEFADEILIDHKYNKSANLINACKQNWYKKVAYVDFCDDGPANYYLSGK